MELTPPAVSSLLSHYQLQQIHASRNNEQRGEDGHHQSNSNFLSNHHLLSKDKNKHHAEGSNNREEGSSPRHHFSSDVYRNYTSSSLQSDSNHGNHQTVQHIADRHHHIHGEINNLTDTSSGIASLQSQEPSKFFMSSLLNLSSATSASQQASTESEILPYQGTGNLFEKSCHTKMVHFYSVSICLNLYIS